MGGAVAALVMLRLLSSLQHLPSPDQLRCVTFGMPALGSPALGQYIDTKGWGKYFTSYSLPEDPVPRLHLSGRAGGGGAPGGGSSGEGSSAVKESEGGENEAELLERLYKEETPTTGSTATNGNSDAEEDASQIKEQQETTNLKINTPRWSALREVARKAGKAGSSALPRFTLPPFLSYAHFGTPLYLLPTGVSSSSLVKKDLPSNTSSTSASVPAIPVVVLPRGLLATHRMPAYRSRLLEICHKYYKNNTPVENNHLPHGDDKKMNSSDDVKEAFHLAPQVTIATAATSLPVLYKPPNTTNTANSSSYSLSNLVVNPLRRPTLPLAVGSNGKGRGMNARSDKIPPLGKSMFTMNVRIQGEGVDTCTGASLTFPAASSGGDNGGGGSGASSLTVFGRAVNLDRAKQLTFGKINQFYARNSEENTENREKKSSNSGGSMGRSLLHALGDKFPLLPISGRLGTDTTTENEKVESVLPETEFVFEVPTEALLQLQLLPTNNNAAAVTTAAVSSKNRMPMIELNLFSDFAKTPVSVQCIPQTAWILPLNTHLGDRIFEELLEAAQEDRLQGAAAAVATGSARMQLAGKTKHRKQSYPAPHHIYENGQDDGEQNEGMSSEKPEQEVLPAVSWKEKILQRLRPAAGSSSSSSPSPLRSVLYRGVLITDISNALNQSDTDDIKSKLQLATELLQWTAQQEDLKNNASGSSSSGNGQADIWEDDLEIPVHDYEIDSLLQNDTSLSLGTRLKRQLRRAISTATSTAGTTTAPLQIPIPFLRGKAGKSAAEKHRLHTLWEYLFKDRSHVLKCCPDVVVIVATGEILKSQLLETENADHELGATVQNNSGNSSTLSSTSSEFNLSLLDAVHALAAASGRCHAAALLAVAAPEAKDPAYRRRLSFSSGLYGRPGAVVPIEWQEEEEGNEQQPPLSVNISMLQAAVLAHASSAAAQISSASQRSINGGETTSEVKSILRARL